MNVLQFTCIRVRKYVINHNNNNHFLHKHDENKDNETLHCISTKSFLYMYSTDYVLLIINYSLVLYTAIFLVTRRIFQQLSIVREVSLNENYCDIV